MKFRFNKNVLALVSVLAASPAAFAANPYTDCGIGAALFPETHWAAVSSNVIWDLGSTAITSATSSPNTCSHKNNAVALYIRDTYNQIVEESVKGDYTHLTAALNILECGVSHSAATQKIRSDIGQLITADDYQGKAHLDKSADLFNAVTGACNS